MKKYTINYYTTAGVNMPWETNNVHEFQRRLYEILENEHTVENSIAFHTETIKQEEPVFMHYEESKEDIANEKEYQRFKGARK